jgi:hypothetical protein
MRLEVLFDQNNQPVQGFPAVAGDVATLNRELPMSVVNYLI